MIYTCENNPKYIMKIVNRPYPKSIRKEFQAEIKLMNKETKAYIDSLGKDYKYNGENFEEVLGEQLTLILAKAKLKDEGKL